MNGETFVCNRVARPSRENPSEAHFVQEKTKDAKPGPALEVRIIHFDSAEQDFKVGQRYRLLEVSEVSEEQQPQSEP